MAREMKDSGFEWIGKIPSNWDNSSLKNVLICREGGAWGKEPENELEGTICLRIADFDYTKIRFKECKIEELTKRNYTKTQQSKLSLKKGDILIEKSGGGEKTPVGRAVYYNGEYGNALFANFMERLRFDISVIQPQYMSYWLKAWYESKCSPYYINQTTGIQNIDLSLMITKEKVFFPNLKVQSSIINCLNIKCSQIDSLISDKQQQIDKLTEYKKSLIYEYVTGKKEVPAV